MGGGCLVILSLLYSRNEKSQTKRTNHFAHDAEADFSASAANTLSTQRSVNQDSADLQSGAPSRAGAGRGQLSTSVESGARSRTLASGEQPLASTEGGVRIRTAARRQQSRAEAQDGAKARAIHKRKLSENAAPPLLRGLIGVEIPVRSPFRGSTPFEGRHRDLLQTVSVFAFAAFAAFLRFVRFGFEWFRKRIFYLRRDG